MTTAAGAKSRRAAFLRLSDPALRDALVGLLRDAVARSAQRRPDEVRLDWVNADPMPLFLAVRVPVFRDLEILLLPYDLPHCHSIPGLAAHLAVEMRPPPVPSAPLSELHPVEAPEIQPPDLRYDAPLERPVIFVLSPPRSGSTLLSAMLGKHPDLFAGAELHLLQFESMGARRRLLGGEAAWLRMGLYAAIMQLTGMTEEQAEQECLALEAEDVAVSGVYRRLQELAGDRIVVDKSPTYAARPDCLARAERLFRAPRYIHLTRHPGAVIESFVRMRFHRMLDPDGPGWDANPWHSAEKVWTISHLNCLRFLQSVGPDRQLRVSYEALVADPTSVVRRVCDFLEVPFDARLLEPYAGADRRMAGLGDASFFRHAGIDAGLATRWRRHPPPQPLGRTTRKVAETLGYATE